MALQIQNTGSSQVIISELANFTVAPLTTVNAPVGYTEAQIISAISPFDTLVLLGATVDLSIPIPRDAEQLTPQSFKDTIAEMNEAVQTIQTEVVSLQGSSVDATFVNGVMTTHETTYDHTAIAHSNRAVLDALIAIPVTEVKFVDNTRTDSYTEDGSQMKPFKTIQSAIDSISDASNSKKYMVEIKASAYTENLAFKPYVCLKGESKETTKVTGTHLCTFSTGGRLEIRDITIRGTITFDKPAGTVNGVSVWLADMWADSIVSNFRGTVDYLQITNDCLISGNLTQHSSHMIVRDSMVYGNIVIDDVGLEVPDPVYGDSGTRNIANSGLNNVSVINNCWLEIHTCHTWGSLTSDGATAYLNYDVVSAPENPANVIVLNAGNVDLMSHASALANDSSVSGTSVKDALNNCVTKNAINGSFTTVDGKTITVVDGQITSIV